MTHRYPRRWKRPNAYNYWEQADANSPVEWVIVRREDAENTVEILEGTCGISETFDHHPAPEQPTHPEITAAVEAAGTFSQPERKAFTDKPFPRTFEWSWSQDCPYRGETIRFTIPDEMVVCKAGMTWALKDVLSDKRWREVMSAPIAPAADCTPLPAPPPERVDVTDFDGICHKAASEICHHGWSTDPNVRECIKRHLTPFIAALRTENQRLAGEIKEAHIAMNFAGYGPSTPAQCINELAKRVVSFGSQLTAATDRVGRLEECLREVDVIDTDNFTAIRLSGDSYAGTNRHALLFREWKARRDAALNSAGAG